MYRNTRPTWFHRVKVERAERIFVCGIISYVFIYGSELFQSTAAGLIGLTGVSALLHVDKEPRLEQEPAQILPLLTVELTVRDQALRLKIVSNNTVQLMVDGVSSESGRTAPLLVLRGEEPRPRPELVPTQSLLMGD